MGGKPRKKPEKKKGSDVLVFRRNEPPRLETVSGLRDMQLIVGGYIEGVYLDEETTLYCNENGIGQGLPFNRNVEGHQILGDFFIQKTGRGEEAQSLSAADVSRWKERSKGWSKAPPRSRPSFGFVIDCDDPEIEAALAKRIKAETGIVAELSSKRRN